MLSLKASFVRLPAIRLTCPVFTWLATFQKQPSADLDAGLYAASQCSIRTSLLAWRRRWGNELSELVPVWFSWLHHADLLNSKMFNCDQCNKMAAQPAKRTFRSDGC